MATVHPLSEPISDHLMHIPDQASSAATTIRQAVIRCPDYQYSPFDATIKLDQNESPDDFPQELKDLACEAIRSCAWHRYPDLHAERIRAAISDFEDWPADGIVVTPGSNVLIHLATQLAGMGRAMVTVSPHFAMYAMSAAILDADIEEVPLGSDLAFDADAVIDALGRKRAARRGGVLFLTQPHSPSGMLVPKNDLEAVVDHAHGYLTILDEAYHQFAGTDLRDMARGNPGVAVLRTFSKAWGLAGIRLGYLLASCEVARQLRKTVFPFCASALQAAVVKTALDHPAYVSARVALIAAERERLLHALRRHPSWQPFPSHANFILVRTPNAEQAHLHLLGRGILVRRQDHCPALAGCIRVTVGTPAENDAFLEAAAAAG